MSCKVINEENKPKKTTEAEPVVEEKKVTEEVAFESPASVVVEDVEDAPIDSLQAIGHVPLPGSGGGKGKGTTTVQKKR